MDEHSRRSAVNHLIQRLSGGVRLQAEPAKAIPQNWPMPVFEAPRPDPWLIGCLLTLAIVLTVAIIGATVAVVWLSKGEQFSLWLVPPIVLLLAPGLAFLAAEEDYLSTAKQDCVGT